MEPNTNTPPNPEQNNLNGEVVQPSAPSPAQPVAPEVLGPAPTYSSENETIVSTPPASSSRFGFLTGRKKLLVPVAVAVVLLGGSAAAYFGYYKPNQPQNIWNSALVNTGKGYDKLTTFTDNYTKVKGTTVKGSFKVSGDVAADGTISGSSDNDNSDTNGTVSAGGLKVNYDVRTIKSAGNTPDIYFKVDGIQGIGDLFGAGDPTVTQGLNALNGNWYFIDHSFFDQLAPGSNEQFSTKDIKPALDAIGKANKQYIFTKDTSKQAFVIKEQVGKEKQDGRNVYHYKAGINKANLKAWNTAVCDNLKDTKLFKMIEAGQDSAQALKDCKDTSDIDKMNTSDTADVWVDTHTKLIHKVRFYSDQKNKDNYVDVGQDYQGGDAIPFTLGFNEKSGGDVTTGSLKMVINTKTNVIDVSGQANTTGSSKENATFSLTITPSSSPVKVQAPAGAKNLIQLLNDLGFGSLFSDVQGNAKDTERKTDINAMESQMEVYYVDKGYYPTLAEVNNPSWRSANMKGADNEAFKDPEGASATLAAAPAANVYAYQPTPAGCDNVRVQCNDYTLTATLSDGTTYVKHSLNGPNSGSDLMSG